MINIEIKSVNELSKKIIINGGDMTLSSPLEHAPDSQVDV